MTDEPLEILRRWWQREAEASEHMPPTPACLSTIGLHGHPNARFMDLKDVEAGAVVVTGNLSSRRADEIAADPRVALTCWWPATRRQVRLQGTAVPLPGGAAKAYFEERSRDAQLLSWVSRPGRPISEDGALERRIREAAAGFEGRPVPMPESWGGYRIVPVRLEFLRFNERRLHVRELHTVGEEGWEVVRLEP